ncbi:MAG: type II toxin-antitoxin system MqsA family antitoxin [Prolixibacteraceae bacterium]|nr:type II toxin-antitoxin system MqsA family antitoxin [Prolixibacteraceae bacterium]
MECVICKNGMIKEGKVTVTLEREGTVVVIKDVPAMVCQNCGEYFLNEEMTARVLSKAEKAAERGVEVEVINMDKVA